MPILAKYSYLCNRFSEHSRRDGRVVDYNGLENRRAERHRGFESLSLRKKTSSSCLAFFLLRLRTGFSQYKFYKSKTSCFTVQTSVFQTAKYGVLEGKTTCFTVSDSSDRF